MTNWEKDDLCPIPATLFRRCRPLSALLIGEMCLMRAFRLRARQRAVMKVANVDQRLVLYEPHTR